jgi:maleate cis-trans isomerase
MYGWRARLGILVPSGIIATEPDCMRLAPEGVSCHFHRVVFTGGNDGKDCIENLKNVGDQVVEATRVICDCHPAVICLSGTGVSFVGGYGYDQMIIQKMKLASQNLPCTTTTTSVIEALKVLGVKKVSIAMPYREEPSRIAGKFVEDSGFQVLDMKWLGRDRFDIPETSEETIYHLAREVDKPESEAIFISCTNLHNLDIIELLESDLGKPVVTSNQATMWNMLRMAKINDQFTGFGRLFSQH